MEQATPTHARPTHEPLEVFLDRYRAVLRRVFRDPEDDLRTPLGHDVPPSDLRAMLATGPLRAFIPAEHGGRGGHVHEAMAVLETSGYESLAMCLTIGINGALFLQPVTKYGSPELRSRVFPRFVDHQNMGGLMMTEPDYGSDALSMETAWWTEGDDIRIRGVKHWAGLTGLADYWLMTARSRNAEGRLTRDVDFFVLDTHDPEQAVLVEERFRNLGLFEIPYGRNRVDVRVPNDHRLQPHRTGLKMMLDLLHRSRTQFPGMAIGFLRRLADEALHHVQTRHVGGRSLLAYDQVHRRLAELQASVTLASAMCVHASERAGIEHDLSKDGLVANVVKAVITDRMHDGAQSFLQLMGAKGYRQNHLAGRALIDARPFQIFEGSNDILYEQIGTATLGAMRKAKERHLGTFLSEFAPARRAAEAFRSLLDVRIDADLPQRRAVDFGRLIGQVVSAELVIQLGERGYHAERVQAALEQLRSEVRSAFATFQREDTTRALDDTVETGAWLQQVPAASRG
ncbi:MAG: acyl-CoA dehydrogenase family protein [Trueperaceae bacterium]